MNKRCIMSIFSRPFLYKGICFKHMQPPYLNCFFYQERFSLTTTPLHKNLLTTYPFSSFRFHIMPPKFSMKRAHDESGVSPSQTSSRVSRCSCGSRKTSSRYGRRHRALIAACIPLSGNKEFPFSPSTSHTEIKSANLSQFSPPYLSIPPGIAPRIRSL